MSTNRHPMRFMSIGRPLAWLLPIALFVLLLALNGQTAHAQAPSVWLRAGFTPDPHQRAVVAGGNTRASNGYDLNCAGYTDTQPDLILHWSGYSEELRIFATSSVDITLMVRDPYGVFNCSDDYDGSDPLLSFQRPASGYYEIYVGRYSRGTTNARLFISELEIGPADYNGATGPAPVPPTPVPPTPVPPTPVPPTPVPPTPVPPTPVPPTPVPPTPVPPTTGVGGCSWVALRAGFTPDPWSCAFTAYAPASAVASSSNCAGLVNGSPTLRLAWSGTTSLSLNFYVVSGLDTVMAIRDPGGNIRCDDDSGTGLNPQLTYASPLRGTYELYVVPYSARSATGSLFVSEFTPDPQGDIVRLRSGFTPDPYEEAFRVSPVRSASTLSRTCLGQIADEPTAVLQWSGNASHLRFYTASSADTVLVVRDPAGRLHCNDDWTLGSMQAMVALERPATGEYVIYVGSYGRQTSTISGRLFISELRTNNPESPR